MARKLLYRADIIAGLQHVRCEAMAEGMATNGSGNIRPAGSDTHGALEHGFVKMAPTGFPCRALDTEAHRGKNILPRH